MIKLANDLAIPQGIPKDYFKKYVNWRIRNAFYDVAMYIYEVQNEDCSGILHGENHIMLPKNAAEIFAEYESDYRNKFDGENVLVPASIPNEKGTLKKWIAKPLKELLQLMNDMKNEKTPSLEGEYLMFHVLSLAAGYDEEFKAPDNTFNTSRYITKEIAKIALHNTIGYLEEVEENADDSCNAEEIEEIFGEYIQAMTDLREYAGTGSVDIYEALIWDWDYQLLDQMKKIPEELAHSLGIK